MREMKGNNNFRFIKIRSKEKMNDTFKNGNEERKSVQVVCNLSIGFLLCIYVLIRLYCGIKNIMIIDITILTLIVIYSLAYLIYSKQIKKNSRYNYLYISINELIMSYFFIGFAYLELETMKIKWLNDLLVGHILVFISILFLFKIIKWKKFKEDIKEIFESKMEKTLGGTKKSAFNKSIKFLFILVMILISNQSGYKYSSYIIGIIMYAISILILYFSLNNLFRYFLGK